MMRSIWILALSCLTLSSPLPAADRRTAPIGIDLAWQVSLDAQGHVVQLEAVPNARVDRVPQIRAQLAKAVRTWQFLPGMVQGKPRTTETTLHVHATLVPVSDTTFRIRVDRADPGAGIAKRAVPHYPGAAARRHRIGEVILHVRYDTSGKVISAIPVPSSPKVDPSLIVAAQKAAQHWLFQPETVGGHGVAGGVCLPFCFSVGADHAKCDWAPPHRDVALGNGEALALNPAVHLITRVAGRTL